MGPSPCAPCVDRFEPVGDVDIDGLERCLALVAYDAASGPLISQVKCGGDRRAIRWFALGLAQLTAAWRLRPDVITWIPALPTNRARRGFDQSEVLATQLGLELGVQCQALLGRSGRWAQTGRSRRERLRGPELVATTTCGGTVAVVDDVVTTGASLQRGAHALRAAGASDVVGLVATRRFIAGPDGSPTDSTGGPGKPDQRPLPGGAVAI